MIAGVFTVVTPDDCAVVDADDRRKGPSVADLAPDSVATREGGDPSAPCAQPEHLAHRAATDVEVAVQLAVRVVDRTHVDVVDREPGPMIVEQALMDIHDVWVRSVSSGDGGELADQFTGEQSTVMPEEHQQRRLAADHVGDRGARLDVEAFDAPTQHLVGEGNRWGQPRRGHLVGGNGAWPPRGCTSGGSHCIPGWPA